MVGKVSRLTRVLRAKACTAVLFTYDTAQRTEVLAETTIAPLKAAQPFINCVFIAILKR